MWYLMVVDIMSSMMVWWMAIYVILSEQYDQGIWEACEAVKGGGTYTVLPDQDTSIEVLDEHVQEDDTDRLSDGSSVEGEHVGRDGIHNKSGFISNLE